jgi:hypothetical protein
VHVTVAPPAFGIVIVAVVLLTPVVAPPVVEQLIGGLKVQPLGGVDSVTVYVPGLMPLLIVWPVPLVVVTLKLAGSPPPPVVV